MRARSPFLRPAAAAALALFACAGASARVDGGDVMACPAGAPCLEGGEFRDGAVTFRWTGRFDKLHLRWSREGGEEHAKELRGDHDHFTIRNAQPGVTYVFKISGCSSPAIGKDRCGPWDEQRFTAGAPVRPPRAPDPVPVTVLEPAPKPKLGAVGRADLLMAPDWIEARGGETPANAVPLGRDSDGQTLFACSAAVGRPGHETMQPGKLSPRLGACNVAWAGVERSVPVYRVLVQAKAGAGFALRRADGAPLPDRALPAGRDTDGQPLFLCVAAFDDGSTHVGKVQPSWKRCHFGYGGREIEAAAYQVVVRR